MIIPDDKYMKRCLIINKSFQISLAGGIWVFGSDVAIQGYFGGIFKSACFDWAFYGLFESFFGPFVFSYFAKQRVAVFDNLYFGFDLGGEGFEVLPEGFNFFDEPCVLTYDHLHISVVFHKGHMVVEGVVGHRGRVRWVRLAAAFLGRIWIVVHAL